ncbi:hypothetical protein BDZ89DRAFT_1152290, partial [Hymenopellis radicata]
MPAKRKRQSNSRASAPPPVQSQSVRMKRKRFLLVIMKVRRLREEPAIQYFVKWLNYSQADSSWEPEWCFEQGGPLVEVWRQLGEQGWSREDFEGTTDVQVGMNRVWVEQQSRLIKAYYQHQDVDVPDEKLTIRIPPRPERIIPTRRPTHFVEYDDDE